MAREATTIAVAGRSLSPEGLDPVAPTSREYLPPWQHEFRKVPCLLCGNGERVVLVASSDPSVGICEACAVHAHWTWRTLAGDAAPVDDAGRVTRVKVVVSRLAKLPTGELGRADHPESYELAMAPAEGGYYDFPTADLLPGEEEGREKNAAMRALASVGIGTWPVFLEPLFTAHSPRGSLVRIYLATAYADVFDPTQSAARFQWRKWPPWQHARGLYGLYAGLREIWPLRIAILRKVEPQREQITIHVRKGAAEYIRLQQQLRADPETDASMATYLRQSMSDDEKIACKKVMELSDLEAEIRAERSAIAEEADVDVGEEYREGETSEPSGDPLTDVTDETLEEAFLDKKAGDEEEDGG